MLRLIFRTEQKNHQSNKILKKRTDVRFLFSVRTVAILTANRYERKNKQAEHDMTTPCSAYIINS